MTPDGTSARMISLGAAGDRVPSERSGRERRKASPLTILAGVLAGAAFVGGLWLALGLMAPDGGFSDFSPMSMSHDARANRLSEMRPPSPRALTQARLETWAALDQSPVDDAAWLRLAYIDRLQHPFLTAAGRLGLERSYDIAPFGPEVSAWRVRFALENWSALTPDLRRQVLREVELQWPFHRIRYSEMAQHVSDPAGRLALDLELSGLRRQDALRFPAQPKRHSFQ